jgi:superoxide reductase
MKLAETITAPEKEGKEKHVPHIDSPSTVNRGERFEVKVHVGKEIPHPNQVEHHIKFVTLYAKESGAKPVVRVAHAEFGPTFGEPIATFTVVLQKTSDLIAVEFCNIHGLWENSISVTVQE